MNTESQKVLVIDDEPDIRETLEFSLSRRGFDVDTAVDGLEGLEKAKRLPPDFMILDVMLPGCNGYEVSRMLKEWMDNDPQAQAFPIVLLTARKVDSRERELNRLRDQSKPVVLALNKIDLVEKSGLLESIDTWADTYQFHDVVPISAKNGTQINELILAMVSVLPQGPPYFPEDTLTDASARFLAAEMIREQVFRLTGEEIPYATAVTVDAFKEKNRGNLVKIEATIHLERDSQKGIVIGKKGSKLKQIGVQSREQIEHMLGTKVYLKLFVRVQKNWRKDTKAIRRFGY